jgi:uncharacterized oxidoreductase
MPVVKAEDLTALSTAIYEAAGTPSEHAQIVVRHQVDANLKGHDSHGAMLLPTYVNRIERGHIMPAVKPEVISETATTIFVNGQWGFGPVVSEFTMEQCIAKAREYKISVATIREQSHVGSLNDYPLMAAKAGLIGIIMCDSGQGPKSVAPFGGREARLGTNPISMAIPSDLDGPLYLDMATSAAAAGKIGVAVARGEPVPPGWVIDKEGKPTTDPRQLRQGGALLPLGGPDGGYKGTGLAVMVEILCGLLTGLGFGVEPTGRHNDGCFMAVFRVDAFRPLSEFKKDVGDFIRYLKETPPAEGSSGVLYPGEVEHRREQDRRANGIDVEDATWSRIKSLAAGYGLTGKLELA